jgi:DNA helicase HerA-like ATPase
VGVYFVTQNPIDIPDTVLAQLGNKMQHALRAFTPREQKAVKAMAETFRVNPALDVETAVTDLKVGEALVSLLGPDGNPGMVQRALIVPPHGHVGAIDATLRQQVMASSLVAGHYEQLVDRESAEEVLAARADAAATATQEAVAAAARAAEAQVAAAPVPGPGAPTVSASAGNPLADALFGSVGPRGGHREGLLEAMGKSAVRAVGSQVGRQIVRGVLGSLARGK